MTKILTLNNISKNYNDIKVLDNINIDINKNDFISLIGPSGCGKSTLLNIISNIDKDYKGTKDIKTNNISYMFQNDCLLPWLTIYQNATLSKIFNNNIDYKYIDELLIKYGLYEYKDKYINSLSGGLKQRLALIRALATKPDILLLDEPFSALDYQTRLKVSDDVYKIIKNEHKTALIVSHDISECISLCDRIIVLSKRPSIIKNIHEIKLENKSTPIYNRESPNFTKYYKTIWKEIDE